MKALCNNVTESYNEIKEPDVSFDITLIKALTDIV